MHEKATKKKKRDFGNEVGPCHCFITLFQQGQMAHNQNSYLTPHIFPQFGGSIIESSNANFQFLFATLFVGKWISDSLQGRRETMARTNEVKQRQAWKGQRTELYHDAVCLQCMYLNGNAKWKNSNVGTKLVDAR